jgi:hypothetical protein
MRARFIVQALSLLGLAFLALAVRFGSTDLGLFALTNLVAAAIAAAHYYPAGLARLVNDLGLHAWLGGQR